MKMKKNLNVHVNVNFSKLRATHCASELTVLPTVGLCDLEREEIRSSFTLRGRKTFCT
jgi:hypothetical protein